MGNQQERLVSLGYLAGVIDGEGWLGLTKSRKARQLRPIIAVHMVGAATLDHLEEICTSLGWSSHVWHGKDSSRWGLWGYDKVAQVLPMLTPILFVKHRQAILLQEAIDLRAQRPLRSDPSPEEFAVREAISALNTKGKRNNPRARILRD